MQSRLLPAELPAIDGYAFAGTNKPCRTVSGDYYDVVVRPDGRMYFIIADVSGKGVTAALVMASVATAFNIFTRTDPTPADLVRELNVTLAPKTAPTKFVTLVVGVLDPKTGVVEFANAGHVAPLVISRNGVEQLRTTDMVVGLFASAQYRNQSVTLAEGDSIVLFTDLVAAISASALAGDFYEKDGVAIKGYDPVAYFTDNRPVKGSPAYKAEYAGSIFHFVSQANRDAFAANPAKYAPQYNGFCAFGTAGGYKAAIDPAAFTIVNNKLYLNYNRDVRKKWSIDIPGFVAKADKNWPEVAKQTKVIE